MKIYSIYKATNTVNGKVYIGFASNFKNRIAVHRSSSNKEDSKFYRAIRKYGFDAFVWEIIYQSLDHEFCLNIMEPFFIREYDSKNSGYNSTDGGDGTVGRIVTPEQRMAQSIASTGRISKGSGIYERTPKHLEQIEMARRIKSETPMSEITKNKISTALLGKKKTKEHILAMKNRPQDTLTLTCPFCEKTGSYKNMKQWHFERCKKNPDRVDDRPIVTCEYCGYCAKVNPNFYRYHGDNCKMISER